ncbi:hypothetical protein [Oenococcus oeni]|uniref:hypothetical protein n=1 Tax=Oenococcus oeni TaxID=1247 RepID=UPI0008F882BC|nr:hypothetical protein [Oenococcus oeni]OIK82334.1 hypothetical protein ATW75_02290 [Oenococcus oeni]OIL15553.1 hypothetical protein ATW95_02640 [Oenococcus oeni]
MSAIGTILIAFTLIKNAIDNYSITKAGSLILNISIYAALASGALNIFQVICLFVPINNLFRIIYIASVFVSNAFLIFVSVIWLSVYQFMFLGISLGLLGLILISFQVKKRRD